MSDTLMTGTRLGIGRVIQLTLGMMGRNAASVLLLSLAYAAISAGVPLLIRQGLAAGAGGLPAYLAWVPAYLINLAPSAFVFGCMTLIVVGDLGGQRPGLGTAARGALRVLLPALLLSIAAGLGFVLGLVLLIVPGVLLILRWWVVLQVRFMESVTLRGAFSRSAALTKGSRGALFGLLVIFIVFVVLFTGLLILGMGGLARYQALTLAHDPALTALQLLLNTVTTALTGTSGAVIYAELRRIKEGALPGQLAAIFE